MFVLNPNYSPYKNGFYYSCPWIEHGLVFFPSKLAMCCFCGSIQNTNALMRENFDGNNFDIERLFKIKEKFRRFHKKGKIHLNCSNCPSLKFEAWDERDYIDCLYISHWTACNSHCCYCFSSQNIEKFKFKGYKVYDIISSLFDKGFLRRNSKILFGGGEPAMLDEFEKLINFFLDSGFQNIRVHSSGIKYINCIEKGLSEGKIHLTISVDAGSAEVYKKIKNVDCYQVVRNNIKKYACFKTENGEANVSAKYIIIPGINDSKEEIEKWLLANKEDGLSYTILDVEENWYNQHKNSIPDYICELLRYAQIRSSELHTHFELYERIGRLFD